MTRRSWGLLLWSVSASLGIVVYLAVMWSPSPPASLPSWAVSPAARLDPPRISLGETGLHSAFSVALENPGKGVLHLKGIVSQDRALTLRAPSYRVQPGQRLMLSGRLKTEQAGPFHGSLVLLTDDPDHLQLTLVVDAQVAPR